MCISLELCVTNSISKYDIVKFQYKLSSCLRCLTLQRESSLCGASFGLLRKSYQGKKGFEPDHKKKALNFLLDPKFVPD